MTVTFEKLQTTTTEEMAGLIPTHRSPAPVETGAENPSVAATEGLKVSQVGIYEGFGIHNGQLYIELTQHLNANFFDKVGTVTAILKNGRTVELTPADWLQNTNLFYAKVENFTKDDVNFIKVEILTPTQAKLRAEKLAEASAARIKRIEAATAPQQDLKLKQDNNRLTKYEIAISREIGLVSMALFYGVESFQVIGETLRKIKDRYDEENRINGSNTILVSAKGGFRTIAGETTRIMGPNGRNLKTTAAKLDNGLEKAYLQLVENGGATFAEVGALAHMFLALANSDFEKKIKGIWKPKTDVTAKKLTLSQLPQPVNVGSNNPELVEPEPVPAAD